MQAPSMLPSSHPKITHLQVNPRVAPATDLPPKTAKLQSSSGMLILVEDTAESVSSAYVEVSDASGSVALADRKIGQA